jgi:hypothetical protein
MPLLPAPNSESLSEKTPHSRYKAGEITCSEYHAYLDARRERLTRRSAIQEFKDAEKPMHLRYKSGEISYLDYRAYLAAQRKMRPHGKSVFQKFKDGDISRKEYFDYFARCNGYKDGTEYTRQYTYQAGLRVPASQNKECSLFLGVYVAESLLSKIFHDVQRMPPGHPGYDLICANGFKIDVKSSCLRKKNDGLGGWHFNIERNKVADYFIMVGFDNRHNLQPQHIWSIKGIEVLNLNGMERALNDRHALHIPNSSVSIGKYAKYELTDKLVCAAEICGTFVNNRGATCSTV